MSGSIAARRRKRFRIAALFARDCPLGALHGHQDLRAIGVSTQCHFGGQRYLVHLQNQNLRVSLTEPMQQCFRCQADFLSFDFCHFWLFEQMRNSVEVSFNEGGRSTTTLSSSNSPTRSALLLYNGVHDTAQILKHCDFANDRRAGNGLAIQGVAAKDSERRSLRPLPLPGSSRNFRTFPGTFWLTKPEPKQAPQITNVGFRQSGGLEPPSNPLDALALLVQCIEGCYKHAQSIASTILAAVV